MKQRVDVALGNRSYGIVIGSGLADDIVSFVRAAGYSARGMIVTDTNIAPLYAAQTAELLARAGVEAEVVSVPAGESAKSLTQANELFTRAIEMGLDRKSPIIALGGGVVGDLAGFVAATYMRGIPFIQLPTSLLAQVDSSVGGKVAVNHPLGKNLIGAFHQPDAVFMDLDVLKTLPAREIATGLGEIIKYGIICDADFFAWLEEHRADVLALEPAAAMHMIARSCAIKADVVRQDEREGGLRRILNFGHTIAHAVEKETGYARYRHGEAVAIGMVGAADISVAMGLLGGADRRRIERLIRTMGLPYTVKDVTPDAMYEDLFHDKKTVGGRIHWVLAEGIGKVSVHSDVPEDVVREMLLGLSS
nr:3-dehydroquinate synthase [uncultured Selenomonas sp.]